VLFGRAEAMMTTKNRGAWLLGLTALLTGCLGDVNTDAERQLHLPIDDKHIAPS
jgi:hypothetical protein